MTIPAEAQTEAILGTRARENPLSRKSAEHYWGRGNDLDGLMTICHDARKGRYIGSHWPNHLAPRLYSTRCRRRQTGSRAKNWF